MLTRDGGVYGSSGSGSGGKGGFVHYTEYSICRWKRENPVDVVGRGVDPSDYVKGFFTYEDSGQWRSQK